MPKSLVALFVLYTGAVITFWGGIAYIALHFIGKFW